MKLGLGLGITQQMLNSGGSSSDYYTPLIDYATAQAISTPPVGYLTALETMLGTIAAYDNGALFINAEYFRVYAYDAVANEFTTINIANPGTYDATIEGSPTFIAKKGLQGSTASDYLNSTWRANLSGVDAEDFMVFAGVDGRTGSNNANIFGVRGGNNAQILLVARAFFTGIGKIALNQTSPGDNNFAAPKDGYISVAGLSRSGFNDTYINGSFSESLAVTTRGLPDFDLIEGAYRNTTVGIVAGPNNVQLTALYIGKADAGGIPVLDAALDQYRSDISAL